MPTERMPTSWSTSLSLVRLPPLSHLLKAMLHEGEDELTEEDRRAVRLSREYFRQGGEGLSFEQVIAQLGFTMDQVLGQKGD